MREICTSGSEGGGGFSLSLPLSEDHGRATSARRLLRAQWRAQQDSMSPESQPR